MTDLAGVDANLLSTAKERFEKRFRLADRSDPVMALLFEQGKQRLAEEVSLFPDVYGAAGISRPEGTVAAPDMEGLLKTAKIPAVPSVLFELQRVMDDPTSSASDLAKVIANDPKLTTSLLRIANSPLYSFPATIETVDRAVAVLGTAQVSTLASGAVLLNLFSDTGPALDVTRFWRHSVACGVLAREISVRLDLGRPDRFFVAGLLHDIGWLALAASLPDAALTVLAACRNENLELSKAEQRIVGFSHGKFGAFLLKKWNFPLLLVGSVAFHHAPDKGEKWTEPKVVHVANILANGLGLCVGLDVPVQPLHSPTWKALGMDGVDLEGMIAKASAEMEATFEAFGLK